MNEVKDLMLQAIQENRPLGIIEKCDNIWNMPFFFKVDKAKAITISYNPSIKGIEKLCPYILQNYQTRGIDAEKIYNFQYNYYDKKWRVFYNQIFEVLGIVEQEITHLDVSIFPYKSLNDCLACKHIDKTDKYLLKVLELLSNQIKYILIDGKNNREVFSKFLSKDYFFVASTKLPVNSGGNLYDLLIGKHKSKNTYLIYFGCFLYGSTTPSKLCVAEIANYIKNCT